MLTLVLLGFVFEQQACAEAVLKLSSEGVCIKLQQGLVRVNSLGVKFVTYQYKHE